MIHWWSAEGRALLLFILFGSLFSFFVFRVPFFPFKWIYELVFGIILILSCRLTARGSGFRFWGAKLFSYGLSPLSPHSERLVLNDEEPMKPKNFQNSSSPFAGLQIRPSTRVAVVTGASSGVGYAVSRALALSGAWIVIMTGPNLQRVLRARRNILEELQNRQKEPQKFDRNVSLPKIGGVFVLEAMDLSDEHSVRSFACKIMENEEKLPVSLLVNAAATLDRKVHFCKLNSRWWSVEKMLATNAVGPMLLSLLLKPVLQRTAKKIGVPSRIINVASSCHSFLSWLSLFDFFGGISSSRSMWRSRNPLQMISELCIERSTQLRRPPPEGIVETLGYFPSSTSSFSLDKLWGKEHHPRTSFSLFPPLQFVMYYALSKLCVIWNSHFLSQQLEREYQESNGNVGKVLVCCTHPGISCTHLYRCLFPTWVLDNLCYYPSLLVGKTQQESANSTLLAIHEDENFFVNDGYYLCDGDHSQRRQHYWHLLPFLMTGLKSTESSRKVKTHLSCLSAHARNESEVNSYIHWLSSIIPELHLQGTC